MKRLFVANLPKDATETSVLELFAEFGKVHSIKLSTDLFSGKCIGFGFIEMEGHEARTAIEKLSGRMFGGNSLKVKFDYSSGKKSRRR